MSQFGSVDKDAREKAVQKQTITSPVKAQTPPIVSRHLERRGRGHPAYELLLAMQYMLMRCRYTRYTMWNTQPCRPVRMPLTSVDRTFAP